MSNFKGYESNRIVQQTPTAKTIAGKFSYPHNSYDCYHEEQFIYQHLLNLVNKESPSQMVDRFRLLFIQRANYPEPEILTVLDKITASGTAKEEFKFFLNRCCHILINRWYMQPQLNYAISDLISLFETQSVNSIPHSRYNSRYYKEISRLRELINLFIESEQYLILRRFIQVVQQPTVQVSREDKQPLITLIRRYPYLYEHCLMAEDSTLEQKDTVRNVQAQVQRKFEIDLSQYVTYKLRKIQMLKNVSTAEANRILRPVNNPTLLTDNELYTTLKHFIGKVDHGNTYHESAQKFIQYGSQAANFGSYKNDLYDYLVTSVDQKYGMKKFNDKLYNHLQGILPQANEQKVNDTLVVRTCSSLLNFLVVNNKSSPQHFVFLDLISNQGTVPTMGLLFKIVLICNKVRPHLEKKFAILFNHYESFTTDSIGWLVGTLEQLNIAFSLHFGNLDLSFFKRFC